MLEIPQELTSPEVVEMDFGDCMDFLKNNGTYLDLCWLKKPLARALDSRAKGVY